MKRAIATAVAIFLSALCAHAQEWPAKPVRIVVPFAAGATPDIVARLIAERLQEQAGQTFIVENKPGASGNAGTDTVAKAAPDGATIGVSIGGPLAINTLLFAHLPYDPRKDLTLITLLATQPSALAVNSNTILARSARGRFRSSPWRPSRSRAAPAWCMCLMLPHRRRSRR
jgi:tripartite-type tricarboxylate transporter receptor subunit TctC